MTSRPSLVSSWRRGIARCLGDGAYDSGMVFEALEARGIEAVIKPRWSSCPAAGASARGWAVVEFLDLVYEAWACEKGYGMQWMVETAYSTFKRLFGEFLNISKRAGQVLG